MTDTASNNGLIRIRGARQNNLKNIDLDLRTGDFTVVTGLSGSGKSSLVFDTLYAEGQRRYVETFSPYARQFLDRMDRPHVDRIDGVPPAIAIDQNSTVRTSRSTVGTMTELNDHIKLLFAHHAELYCPKCGRRVVEHTPQSIWDDVLERLAGMPEGLDSRVLVTFDMKVPKELALETAETGLSAQGFTRIESRRAVKDGTILTVVADRFRASSVERSRAIEAIEQALDKGAGAMAVLIKTEEGSTPLAPYRKGFGCADCDKSFSQPSASLFSFNSPVGACEKCRGFGRIITVDPSLVIPDPSKTLEEGAVKPWTTKSFNECQQEMLAYAAVRGIRTNTPYKKLTAEEKRWVWEGGEDWTGNWRTQWYGINRFFEWLESKTYKMHVRMLLSRYRSYTECPSCRGSHLKQPSLFWRYGTLEEKQLVLAKTIEGGVFKPIGMTLSDRAYAKLPGFNYHELMTLPIEDLRDFFKKRRARADESEQMLLDEICSRLTFLGDVGVGYLTLDRQSRTLSGGEVQRVSLTTALGTALVNTLFVLDEPSIGLHPRDMHRVNRIMRRLTEAGNTLVVVEHDPQVMLAANRLIDMGPGSGTDGGRIIFDGSTREVLDAGTLTGDYLSGRRRVRRPDPEFVTADRPRLIIKGASEHNLRHIDVAIPMGAIVAIAGVSGSGKSTLVSDILVPALKRKSGKSTDQPGKFDGLAGCIPHDVIYVDQSPIGRTTRGNPVSYVGSFDGIRSLFAATPMARHLGLSVGDFSFNSGKGRCPTCGGAGFEHIEMQFLSDVYLPCPACGGKRYKDSTLEVKIRLSDDRDYSIADVLDMTADEATRLFFEYPSITWGIQQLCKVGLGYLKLGQPLTTLSGGERQRLKLAGTLSEGLSLGRRCGYSAGKLFVFDEPTTGLHFGDTATLVCVFNELICLGHSVLVIEHNLDVLNTADWIIELGPAGGRQGGLVVFEGTPDQIVKEVSSFTGRALRDWRNVLDGQEVSRESFFNFPPMKLSAPEDNTRIVIQGAREHNLKNLSVTIPRDKFTVVTGPSGSGKSTLAFDLVFAEGQRRYLESLNAYARSMVQPAPAPEVDSIRGIPPTVAIEQRTSRGGLRSTVGTTTELLHFLRLLFVKLGTQYCPDCGIPASPQSHDDIIKAIRRDFGSDQIAVLAPIVRRQKGIFRAEMEAAAVAGHRIMRIDGAYIDISLKIPSLARYSEHELELAVGICGADEQALEKIVAAALLHGHGRLLVTRSLPDEPTTGLLEQDVFYSTLAACPSCLKSFPALDPKLFSYNSSAGACPKCSGYGLITSALKKAQKKKEDFNTDLSDTEGAELCPDCLGTRLNPVARAVRWHDRSISDFGAMTIDSVEEFFRNLRLEGREAAIAHDAVAEILSRLSFLQEVGLGYLTLDRSAPTLSGGEAQRIRLAAQLGSNLRGVCYVLDEPTIGLHPRDNRILLDAIDRLTHQGNTLLVVEHDEDTIRQADHIIDIGPGSGVRGGELVAEGTVDDIMKCERSLTGEYLRNPSKHRHFASRPFNPETDPKLSVINPRMHNLAGGVVEFPLNRLTVVTGVSGSGKSTLTREVLFENLIGNLGSDPSKAKWKGCDIITGREPVARVLEVDQTPIGKTPRSCPATYVGFFDKIRALFAGTNEGKARGYGVGRFSFNNEGGRCEACAGQGLRTIEMSFLPDVKVPCEVCHGARFNQETLAVTWKDRNIGEILQMQVDEAVEFFNSMPTIAHPLKLLQDIGLGYLTLGQPSPTLSGGEAQRIKLVSELTKVKDSVSTRGRKSPHTLYVLDEPTVGLHMADVDKLIGVLKRLVDAGNTVIVVEHNLDLMAQADWIVDMGPEGGANGGRVVATGTPETLTSTNTHTGRALKAHMDAH